MTLQQLLAQLLERGNAMQSFWGFYITVALGLLAFFGSSKRPIRLTVLVSFAFVAFAIVNASGMLDIAKQREVLWHQLPLFVNSPNPVGSPLNEAALANAIIAVTEPPPSHEIRLFHIGCDVAVFIGIWVLTLWRSDSTKTNSGGETSA